MNKLILFISSFGINFILLKLINSAFFGIEIKQSLNRLLNLKLFSLFYVSFIFILMITIKFKLDVIYLDSVIVKVPIGSTEVTIEGDYLKTLFDTGGEVAVFGFGSRLAYLIVSKKASMNVASKIGVIIGSGATSTASLRYVRSSIPTEVVKSAVKTTLKFNNINVEASGDYTLSKHPYLDFLFGTAKTYKFEEVKFETITSNGKTIIKYSEDMYPILSKVKEKVPNWEESYITNEELKNALDSYIHSPLENNDWLTNYLIENLTNHFIINTITVYLLIMLTIIFICKLLITKDIQLKFLTNLTIFKIQIGLKINKLLNWYINIWQKSSNYWIFFILFILIFSNSSSLYGLNNVLKVLKNYIN